MKNTQNFPLTLFTSLLIVILVELLLIYCLDTEDSLVEVITLIYGGFVATLIGVYWSINLTKQQETERDKKLTEKILIGSLKVIWSELDFNLLVLSGVLGALENMPKETNVLYSGYLFARKIASPLKSQAFYSAFSSGQMIEIAAYDKIFNALQQAYYNMELSVRNLAVSQNICDEYKNVSLQSIPTDQVENAKVIVEKDINQLKGVMKFLSKAKDESASYLEARGVKFYHDKPVD